MSNQLIEGWGWTNFSNFAIKATKGAGFFGSPGTLTGSIDAGPLPNTKALHLKEAAGGTDSFGNTGYFIAYALGTPEDVWMPGFWIFPHAITSRRSIFLLEADEPPNRLPTMMFHINAANKLELDFQAASVAQPRMNTLIDLQATSHATIPMDQWTHIAVKITALNASNGKIEIWINGSLDTSLASLNIGPTTKASQAWIVWQNGAADAAEMTWSQLVVNNTLGARNNTVVRPGQHIETDFPTSDFANGSWVPSVAGPNYPMVNSPIGPTGTFVSLSVLTSPDELFNMADLSDGSPILAIAANIACVRTGSFSLQPEMEQASSIFPMGTAFSAPTVLQVIQTIAETNPATGLSWSDTDVSVDAFGFKAAGGTGGKVEQFFLEKLLDGGIGSYSF